MSCFCSTTFVSAFFPRHFHRGIIVSRLSVRACIFPPLSRVSQDENVSFVSFSNVTLKVMFTGSSKGFGVDENVA